MSTWDDVRERIRNADHPDEETRYAIVRRETLHALHELLGGRNIVACYSGWLTKPIHDGMGGGLFELSDYDTSGLIAVTQHMDFSKGLALLLHSKGGGSGAAEGIGDFLRTRFHGDVWAIVPQIAMSSATAVACACRRIYMADHSSLGPIDPKLDGASAPAIVSEIEQAWQRMDAEPARRAFWTAFLHRYPASIYASAVAAIKLTNEDAAARLRAGMFATVEDGDERADRAARGLSDFSSNLSHNRHISSARAREIGLQVERLEADPPLYEAVMAWHYAAMQTLTNTPAAKLVENHLGMCVRLDLVPIPPTEEQVVTVQAPEPE